MFVVYATYVNGFKLGCKMILFVYGTYLSKLYKGVMLVACALDANNNLFNFAYAIVVTEKIEE